MKIIKYLYKMLFDKTDKEPKRYEWNINYMKHDFSNIKVNAIDMRKCEKCGIFVHHDFYSDRYNTHEPQFNYNVYPTLTLTCEEVIIKNLLE